MRTTIIFAAVLFGSMVYAEKHDPLHASPRMEAILPGDAPIKITINPEARVSVSLGGELPPPPPCGAAMELRVAIVNQAVVTAPLQATLVGYVPPGIRLDLQDDPLKGIAEEVRILRVTLRKPEPTDLTISFRARNDIPDLGGRDRIHLLLRCN